MKLSDIFRRRDPGEVQRTFPLKYLIFGLLGVLVGSVVYLLVNLGQLSGLLTHYPELTGFPLGTRNYLILFQNNYELRPTGGFISAYGILGFQNGFFKYIEIHDSYDEINEFTDKAPYPLDILLAGPTYPGHGFRDANFHPDFPHSANELQKFFNKAYPDIELNGVIAVDLKLIEYLLKTVGPVSVEGVNFSAENLFKNMETAVSDIDLHNLNQIKNRKNVLKNFAVALRSQIPLNIFRAPEIKQLLIDSLNEKHIILYFQNPTLQNLVKKKGWDGNMEKKEGDYLAVIEGNFGGMKSDRYIRREVYYSVDIGDDLHPDGSRKASAILDVHLTHSGAQNIPLSGWYQGWIRSFIPLGSEIKKREIFDQNFQPVTINDSKKLKENFSEETGGLLGIGDRIVFQPGEKRILRYQFQLPAGIITDRTYILNLHKQPGTDADFYSVIVKVPQGRQLKSQNFEIFEDRAFFRGFLKKDLRLALQIMGDKSPPRIIGQEIPSLNEINIHFNEPLDNKWNYYFKVEDLNLKNDSVTDVVKVESVEFPDERTIRLRTSGMTDQGVEHFGISLDGIRDRYGNKIDPSPRTITAVYKRL